MPAAHDVATAARAHLVALAREPRPAGGPAEAEARDYARDVLACAGYVPRDEPFAYSAAVGRYGTPLAGVVAGLTFALVASLGIAGRPLAALTVLGGVALALGVAGRWAARVGVLGLPFARRRGVNVVAVHRDAGEAMPRVWLVAHLDSKSQPVPSLVRVAAVAGVLGTTVLAVGIAASEAVSGMSAGMWPWLAAMGVLSSLPIALAGVGASSPGALDNASGVATVLAAATMLAETHERARIGVLLTSAEELGLAGARAWAAAWGAAGRAPGVALNCDGVDDRGDVVLMHGAASGGALVARLRAALPPGVRARRIPAGLLVDSVAFGDAGWETLTVSRGTVASLRRVHTPADTLDHLDGRGIPEVAHVLVRAARAEARRVLAPDRAG